MITLLRANRDLRWLFIAQVISFMGDWFSFVAVTGIVKEVDAKGAVIELDGGIEGYIKANDIAKERIEDAREHLKVGDSIEAKFIGNDRKGRVMQLSIRAKDEAELQETLAEVNNKSDASSGTTKLGALLREQMGKGE